MPELVIHVPSYIGPSYFEESEDGWWGEYVQGITKADVEMLVQYAEWSGQPADSILLEIGICDGGSTVEGFNIYNYLRGLGLPIRVHITSLACSMAVPLALVGDAAPEMEYTSQMMLHSASFNGGVYATTSVELRAQADRLDNTNQLLTDLLIARTGQTAEVVAGWMSKDTWLTASQAAAVGLCSKVIPLTPAIKPVEAEALITARRRRATEVQARRAKAAPTAKTPAAPAAAAPRPALPPVPMATPKKPTPRTPAAAAAPKTAQPKARKSFWQSLKEFAQQADQDETEANAAEAAADVQSTVLADNNGTLYHDGALAVDAVVYTDEALTTTADAGEYDTDDDQTITVGDAGVVTAIGATATAAGGTETPAATAALAKRLDRLEASLATVTKERDDARAEAATLKKAKPALPQARAARPNAEAPDPKTPKAPKATAAHHAQL